VAYAVSRRVGPAVVRNRIRRQLRAAVERIDRDAGVLPGWYLVVVHPPARGQDFDALSGALRTALADGRRLEQAGPP
jgi:ribonuclease P protein component